jgi:Domain of unknown function (DUF4266)
VRRSVLLIAAALLAGCASVAPWERGHLARPDMGLEPSAALRALDKTYAAKEAGSGGAAVGGGGCGCN